MYGTLPSFSEYHKVSKSLCCSKKSTCARLKYTPSCANHHLYNLWSHLSSTPSRKVKSIKHKFPPGTTRSFIVFKASLHGGIIVKQYEHVTKSTSAGSFFCVSAALISPSTTTTCLVKPSAFTRDFAMANKASDKSHKYTFVFDSRICSVTNSISLAVPHPTEIHVFGIFVHGTTYCMKTSLCGNKASRKPSYRVPWDL